MSFEAFEKAWESPSPPAHKLVLLAVADQADEYGCAVVNLGSLGRKCNMTLAEVQTALDNLTAAGEVSVEGRQGESLLVRVYPNHTFQPGQSPLRQLFGRGGEG